MGYGNDAKAEIKMHLHHETPKAILASDDGNESRALWFPKSMIEWERKREGRPEIDVTMPEWLAKKNGLI